MDRDNNAYNDRYDDEYSDICEEKDEEINGIAEVETAEPERIDGYMVSDIEMCIQKKSEYYLNYFRKQPKLHLNWAAFIFGRIWMAYRHMWREAVITSLLEIPAAFALPTLFIKLAIANGFYDISIVYVSTFATLLIFCILYGLWGNTLYWKKLKRELNRFNRKDSTVSITEEEKENLLKSNRLSAMYVFAAWGINWVLYWISSTLAIMVLSHKLGIA